VRPARGDAATLAALAAGTWPELVRTAALWLHAFIDEAHEIAQDQPSTEGSYWHALVHRSEGDLDNSMYWFGRVRSHAIFGELHGSVAKLPGGTALAGTRWEPRRLVDLCGRAREGKPVDLDLLNGAARIEYNLLIGYVLGQEK
jgi:hypothetical protein